MTAAAGQSFHNSIGRCHSEENITNLKESLQVFDSNIHLLENASEMKKIAIFFNSIRTHCNARNYYFQPGLEEVTKKVQHYCEGSDSDKKYLPSKLQDVPKQPHQLPYTQLPRQLKRLG